MSFKYIFGPINSRRFGLSLGVDLSPKQKSCNFDCLYCELPPAPLRNKIEDEADPKEIAKEIEEALKEFKDIDVITLTANGEPTLYSRLGELMELLEEIKGDHKTLILSNASTIHKRETQEVLKKFDIVKLSLDSADKKVFKKIDRVMDGVELDDIIDGIRSFKEIYRGELVIEILVVKGVNESDEQIKKLDLVLSQIKPDRVDLSTIDRPPAYGVEGVSEDRLKELANLFKGVFVNVVYKKEAKKRIEYTKDELLHTIKLRSLSEFDIKYLLSDKSKKFLDELLDEEKITAQSVAGVKFYRFAGAK